MIKKLLLTHSLLVSLLAAQEHDENHWSTKIFEAAILLYPCKNAMYDDSYEEALKNGCVEESPIGHQYIMTVHTLDTIKSSAWYEFLYESCYEPLNSINYRIIMWDKDSHEVLGLVDVAGIMEDGQKKLLNFGTSLMKYSYKTDKQIDNSYASPAKKLSAKKITHLTRIHDIIMEKLEDLAQRHECSAIKIECDYKKTRCYYTQKNYKKKNGVLEKYISY